MEKVHLSGDGLHRVCAAVTSHITLVWRTVAVISVKQVQATLHSTLQNQQGNHWLTSDYISVFV